jgi:predicted acyltransferase
MLWILGADELGRAATHFGGGAPGRTLAGQLTHTHWEGFRFYDLIFPLFVFMIGVSLTFSLRRILATDGKSAAWSRILRRSALLYVLGLFYYGGFSTPPESMRFVGVLQRLAACYLFASVCYIYLKPRALIATCVALLVGYWALLTFVPVPGYGAGDYAEARNLADWIDKVCLPGRKWHNADHDPEGLLSTLPAMASCLFGVLAGIWLQRTDRTAQQKAIGLAVAGAILLCAGHLWGLQFPVIKRIWTSTYALVAGGWSLLLLATFYYFIDAKGKRSWSMPFVWVGTNALTIYLIGNLVDFDKLSARFSGGSIASWLERQHVGLSEITTALVGIGLCIALCRFLYQRQLFLRL